MSPPFDGGGGGGGEGGNDSSVAAMDHNDSSIEAPSPETFYSPLLGAHLAMPQWEALLTISLLSLMIAGTVVGNVLVSPISYLIKR